MRLKRITQRASVDRKVQDGALGLKYQKTGDRENTAKETKKQWPVKAGRKDKSFSLVEAR